MDYFRKTAAARAEQRRLWPDPAMAPEVPAEEVLAACDFDQLAHVSEWMFSKDPKLDALVENLKRQIGLSENCQLALFAREFEGKAPRKLTEDDLDHLRVVLEDKAVAVDVQTAGFGDVFRTRTAVRIWDRGSLEHRWIFQPTPVVILKEGAQTPWNHAVVRAAACSPVLDEYEVDLADDEILVRAEDDSFWVVHLWLKFPVSVEQLHSRLAHLDSKALENTAFSLAAMAEGLPLTLEEGAGEPLDPKRDAWLILERERLYERAMWLAATADAYFEEWQSRQESLVTGVAEDAAPAGEDERSRDLELMAPFERIVRYPIPEAPREDLQLAAAGENQPAEKTVDLLVIRQSALAFKAGDSVPEPEFGRALYRLTEDGYKTIRGRKAPASWRLVYDGEPVLHSDLVFAVVDRRAGMPIVCATGRLESAERATIIKPPEDSSLADFSERSAEFTLLVFAP